MDTGALKRKFVEVYGGSEEGLRVFSSPGRVNLIGEHTDYNGGYVFPAALTMSSTVVARVRPGRKIRLKATDLDMLVEADMDRLQDYKSLKWGNYQLGVADELQKAGCPLTGCDLLFHDTVPLGSGLSSSAAIQVAAAIALATLGIEMAGMAKPLDKIEMALIAQKSEHNFVGVKCGIMDQFSSAMGKANHAIFLNCRNLDYELVPLELHGYKLVIANTNKKRSLGESKYNERRSECEQGLEILRKAMPQVSCLGEISLQQYTAHRHLIHDPDIAKRVEHIITEDDRVLQSVAALKKRDLFQFGRLMTASHDSLKNLYEVTGKELDTLVEAALQMDGVIGSRMTGAGFGGCTVSLVKENAVERFMEEVGKIYLEQTGLVASFYLSDIGDGGREII